MFDASDRELVDDFRPTPFFSFHHVIRWFDLEVNK
jgi:hypothetical protein